MYSVPRGWPRRHRSQALPSAGAQKSGLGDADARLERARKGEEGASPASAPGSPFLLFPICSTQFPAGRSVPFVPALNHRVPWAWARALERRPVLGLVAGPPPGSCQVSAPGICPFSRPPSNLLLETVGWETSILVIFPSLPKLSKLLHALVEAMGPVWLQALVEMRTEGTGTFKGIQGFLRSPVTIVKHFKGTLGPRLWILQEPEPECNLSLSTSSRTSPKLNILWLNITFWKKGGKKLG